MPYYLLPYRARTQEGRLEILEYCLMDTVLMCYLSQFKMSVINYMSMSAVQLVDIEKKFMSGQQYCALSMMMRNMQNGVDAGGHAFALPEQHAIQTTVKPLNRVGEDDVDVDDDCFDDGGDDGDGGDDAEDDGPSAQHRQGGDASEGPTTKASYKGATVLASVAGFYAWPVVCLDFASLYPSIMRAFNLSYETHLEEADVPKGWTIGKPREIDGLLSWPLDERGEGLEEHDCYQMHNGHIFVSAHRCVRDGCVQRVHQRRL